MNASDECKIVIVQAYLLECLREQIEKIVRSIRRDVRPGGEHLLQLSLYNYSTAVNQAERWKPTECNEEVAGLADRLNECPISIIKPRRER